MLKFSFSLITKVHKKNGRSETYICHKRINGITVSIFEYKEKTIVYGIYKRRSKKIVQNKRCDVGKDVVLSNLRTVRRKVWYEVQVY